MDYEFCYRHFYRKNSIIAIVDNSVESLERFEISKVFHTIHRVIHRAKASNLVFYISKMVNITQINFLKHQERKPGISSTPS